MGTKNFQNDVWGTVVSTNYTFGPGEYDIFLEHVDTDIGKDHDGDGNMDNQCDYWCTECSPDYDYTAQVSQVGGDATVTIEDNEGKPSLLHFIRMPKRTKECMQVSYGYVVMEIIVAAVAAKTQQKARWPS